MSAHARLSASESHRWMHCAGSVRKCRGIKRKSSPSATKGTAVHALGAMLLEKSPKIAARLKESKTLVGWVFDFFDGAVRKKETVTQDMLDAVHVYVNDIERIIRENPQAILHIERKVSLEHVRPNMFGTADGVIDDVLELTVADYKNGVTPVILVEEGYDPERPDLGKLNSQLLFYGAGAAHEFKWEHTHVTLKIHQPNCREVPSIQEVTIDARLLRDWMNGPLRLAALATEDPNAPLTAGPWCTWCPAAGDCEAFTNKAVAIAKADFKGIKEDEGELPVPPDPTSLTNMQLAKVLKWTPVLEKFLKACNARAFELLTQRRGDGLGQKLVRKRANRVFPALVTPEDLANKLNDAGAGNIDPKDLLTEPELKSPAQVELLLVGSKAARKKIVDAVAYKPDGGLTMASLADKRPEEVPTTEDLRNIEEEEMEEME